MSTTKSLALQIGNILAFALTLTINGLANTGIFGGKTTGQISDQYPTLITPAGYVFAIWGLIYTLLAIYVVYQALPRHRHSRFQTQISALFILSSVLNAAWILLWQYNYIAITLVPMLALLGTLAVIYLRLRIGRSEVTLSEKAAVYLPFSIYLAWITVATAANIAAALSYLNIVQWAVADAVWGLVFLVAVLAVTLAIVSATRDVAFGLVIIWALVGIAAKQSEVPLIVYASGIGVAIITVTVVTVLVLSLRRWKH